MIRLTKLTFIVSLVLMCGCALGPDYVRPDGLVPDSFRDVSTSTIKSATSTGFAEMPWWVVFQDQQLQALIQTALENNQDVKIAASRVEEARAALGVAESGLFPVLGASALAARTSAPKSISPPGAKTHSNAFAAMLDLSYEVDLWGRVRRLREAARAELLASDDSRQTVISTLVSDTARSYFNLLELDREVEIATETLHSREKTLELMNLRHEHGVASALEVSRFRAEISSTLAALAALKQQALQSENALSILLGKAPDGIQRGLAFGQQPPIPIVPLGLTSDLLERRPDIKAAERQLAAATARIGAAKAAFFPRVVLTAEYGFQSSELGSLLDANSAGWMIAGNAAQPIFEGGRNWFSYQATKARQEQALQNYRKTILLALREVSDALIARQQSKEESQQRQEQIAALRNSVRLSDMRYRSGQASYLELLDAERQLFASELQIEQSRLEEMLASVRLYKALGGGVSL